MLSGCARQIAGGLTDGYRRVFAGVTWIAPIPVWVGDRLRPDIVVTGGAGQASYAAAVSETGTGSISEWRDHEDVKQLKYRYLRTLDTKQWDEFEACFLPDATADYNGLEFDDRAALVDYMRTNLGEGLITLHQVHHPEIAIDGDTATARWYLQDKVLVAAFGFMLEGAAFYEDRYVRTPEGWRVAHTGYRRTYEATYDLADLPSLSVKGPGEHTHV